MRKAILVAALVVAFLGPALTAFDNHTGTTAGSDDTYRGPYQQQRYDNQEGGS